MHSQLKGIISLTLSLLFLLSGCGKVSPVVTLLPPTLMAASIPSPTKPATPAPTLTSEIMPADPSALSITYICNDGFIIATAGKKILIDALFHDSGNICQADADEIAQNAQFPFDNADLVLISHNHWDHFSPQIVGNYLLNNPKAVVIAEKNAADELSQEFASFGQVQERVHSVQLADNRQIQISVDGIEVEMINAPADVPNLGFLIHVGEITIFHSGDADLDPETAPGFQSYLLSEKRIDIAFVPYWYLTNPEGQSILENGIQAGNYVPMHYAGENLKYIFDPVTRLYPQAILFPEEFKTWFQSKR